MTANELQGDNMRSNSVYKDEGVPEFRNGLQYDSTYIYNKTVFVNGDFESVKKQDSCLTILTSMLRDDEKLLRELGAKFKLEIVKYTKTPEGITSSIGEVRHSEHFEWLVITSYLIESYERRKVVRNYYDKKTAKAKFKKLKNGRLYAFSEGKKILLREKKYGNLL